MANSASPSPAVSINKTATLWHWLLAFLLAAAFALELVSLFKPLNFSGWLDAAFLVIATGSTLAALWRQLPLQNVLPAALGIAVIGGGFSGLGARTALPFGPFIYTPAAGAQMFKTLPWTVPLLWAVVVLNGRGVARLILRPWRKNKTYGFRLIGATALLVLLFDIALEPYAFRVKHYWLWLPTTLPLAWQGTSLSNFLAWALITVLVLLFLTPGLIVKKPRARSRPDFSPLCLWLGGLALFGTGCGVKGLWPPVIVDGAIGMIVAVFALRGALW